MRHKKRDKNTENQERIYMDTATNDWVKTQNNEDEVSDENKRS